MKKHIFQILAAACITVALSGIALADDDDVNKEAFGEYSDTYSSDDMAIPADEAESSSEMQGEDEDVMDSGDADPSDYQGDTSGESW